MPNIRDLIDLYQSRLAILADTGYLKKQGKGKIKYFIIIYSLVLPPVNLYDLHSSLKHTLYFILDILMTFFNEISVHPNKSLTLKREVCLQPVRLILTFLFIIFDVLYICCVYHQCLYMIKSLHLIYSAYKATVFLQKTWNKLLKSFWLCLPPIYELFETLKFKVTLNREKEIFFVSLKITFVIFSHLYFEDKQKSYFWINYL